MILKNENINGEIMENLHQYVPTKSVDSSREIAEKYLFGGDQLISAQARSAKRRQDSAAAVERMEGLLIYLQLHMVYREKTAECAPVLLVPRQPLEWIFEVSLVYTVLISSSLAT